MDVASVAIGRTYPKGTVNGPVYTDAVNHPFALTQQQYRGRIRLIQLASAPPSAPVYTHRVCIVARYLSASQIWLGKDAYATLVNGLDATGEALEFSAPVRPENWGQLFSIDAEILRATTVTGTQMTVQRGLYGTTPASHAANARIEALDDVQDFVHQEYHVVPWQIGPGLVGGQFLARPAASAPAAALRGYWKQEANESTATVTLKGAPPPSMVTAPLGTWLDFLWHFGTDQAPAPHPATTFGICELSCQTACMALCETACESQCQTACETGCQTSCQSTCELACQDGCETTCQDGCQTGCEVGCEAGCQSGCQTTCQTACQTTCQTACQTTCQTACQTTCQTACQSQCQTGCQTSCQTGCQTSCQTGCQTSCQTGCQTSCETGCEVACETGCQTSCETGCQTTCQTGCQTACETGCQITCQTGCQTSCQTGCQTSCETGCQVACETGCETHADAPPPANTCNNCSPAIPDTLPWTGHNFNNDVGTWDWTWANGAHTLAWVSGCYWAVLREDNQMQLSLYWQNGAWMAVAAGDNHGGNFFKAAAYQKSGNTPCDPSGYYAYAWDAEPQAHVVIS